MDKLEELNATAFQLEVNLNNLRHVAIEAARKGSYYEMLRFKGAVDKMFNAAHETATLTAKWLAENDPRGTK